MKKLLLLLLLVPNLIQAEEFALVCEGEKLSMASGMDGFKDKETITVKVREESITIDKVYYSDAKYDDSLVKVETNYINYNDLIQVFSNVTDTPTKKHCGYITYTANIDRVSGVIKTEWRKTDECMNERYYVHVIYEGKCKKQKGNAF